MDRASHFVEVIREKMVCHAHKNHAARRSGLRTKCAGEIFEMSFRGVLIVFSLNQQLWFRAGPQVTKLELSIVNGEPQTNHFDHSRVHTACAQAHPCSKTESRHEKRNASELIFQIIDGAAHILFLAATPIVASPARPHPPEIETQHWDSQRVERLCRPVNHFVVHRALIQGMRMTNNCRQSDLIRLVWYPQQAFQFAACAVDAHFFVGCVHFRRMTNPISKRGLRGRQL